MGGFPTDMDAYRQQVAEVTARQVVDAAQSMELHSEFFLKGVAEHE